MKIIIGFSTPKRFKIGAKLISWWINRPYSHVYMQFNYIIGQSAVFQAAHGSVHFLSSNNFNKDNITLKSYSIEVDSKEHDEIFDECMGLSGEQYSIIALIKIFITECILRLTGKVISFGDTRGYVCSELVGKLCVDRLKIKFNKPTFLLEPSDIDEGLTNG